MVRQGCLALAMAMPRVNLSMIVPFEGGRRSGAAGTLWAVLRR